MLNPMDRCGTLKQHLYGQCPENFCTSKRAEITLQEVVLGGQMRNFKLERNG